MSLKPLTSGWRTYAACMALVAAGVAAAFGIHVPDWLITMVAGAAGIAGRAAITNNARKTAEDARALVQSLAAEVSPSASGSAGEALNAVTDADVANVQSVADLQALLHAKGAVL